MTTTSTQSPNSLSDEATRSRSFCTVFAGIVVTLLALIAFLNFVVDPQGQYLSLAFEPLVQTSRATKVDLLKQLSSLDRTQQPRGLVLGSSRVLKFEPEFLEEKFGTKFFNAGVNYGKTEDALALLRFYESQFGEAPTTVLLGLDVNSFTNVSPPDARLVANRSLSTLIPSYIDLESRMGIWKSLLSWQQTKSSVKSLKLNILSKDKLEPVESFRSDGLIVYHQRMAQLKEGTYDFEGALDYNKHEYQTLFSTFSALSANRIAAFQELVKICETSGARLVVWLTPLHPSLHEHLQDTPEYEKRKSEVLALLTAKASEFDFTLRDFSKLDSFAGDPQLFVDGIHPLEPNTRRMIEILASSEQDGMSPSRHKNSTPHYISR